MMSLGWKLLKIGNQVDTKQPWFQDQKGALEKYDTMPEETYGRWVLVMHKWNQSNIKGKNKYRAEATKGKLTMKSKEIRGPQSSTMDTMGDANTNVFEQPNLKAEVGPDRDLERKILVFQARNTEPEDCLTANKELRRKNKKGNVSNDIR